MPQDFNIVRCFSCETFQVHQVKKSNKWQCKLCGASQTLKKVFGRGIASDCRNHVQQLNMMRKTVDEAVAKTIDSDIAVGSTDELNEDLPPVQAKMLTTPSRSRWSCFLDDHDADRTGTSNVDDEAVYSADGEVSNAYSAVFSSEKFCKQQESYTKRRFAPYDIHHRSRVDEQLVTSSLQPHVANADLCISARARQAIDILNEEHCTEMYRTCRQSIGTDNVDKLDCTTLSSTDIDNRYRDTNKVFMGLMNQNRHPVLLNANMENCGKDTSVSMNAKRVNIFVVSDDDLDDILHNL